MADHYSAKFIQALETHNRETLVAIPKSDLHSDMAKIGQLCLNKGDFADRMKEL